MGLRCKKGDIAIVTSGDRAGTIVDVIKFIGEAVDIRYSDGWHISHRGESRDPSNGLKWICSDSAMRPIRPDELKEEEEKEVTA